jgi:anti-sigma regulatory factor (Ser/Thr protein kinase)
MTNELALPPEVMSVTRARHFVVDALPDELPSVRNAVALMVSELAANALRHARTEFCVRVAVQRSVIRIEVVDDGGGRPRRKPLEPLGDSGRGLHIVDLLSDDWGTVYREDGKTVWFQVRRDATGGDDARPGPSF